MSGDRHPLNDRESGCIVCWHHEGHDHITFEHGRTLDALRVIVNRIPVGGKVTSVSTPASIYYDLTKPSRSYGGRGRRGVDQYAFERHMLGRVGRTDLVP